MTDEPDHNALWPRWLRFEDACAYVGLKPGTLTKKLSDGCGPKVCRSPGSRTLLFWTGDLDKWVRNSPERALTQAEIERYAKLQEGAERAREERRARARAEASEDATA